MKKNILIGLLFIVTIGIYYLYSYLQIVPNIAGPKEIFRLASPDSLVEAVIMSRDAGATTSVHYYLYILPKGRIFVEGSSRLMFSGDHLVDFKIQWREIGCLEIYFKEARIFDFSNIWNAHELYKGLYVVEVRLLHQNESWSLSERDRSLKILKNLKK